jgi:hypothetical protein
VNGSERKYLNKLRADIFYELGGINTWTKKHDDISLQRHQSNEQKFGKIFEWLEGLPCKERRWMPKAIYSIYGMIGGVLILLIYHWVVNGVK